jgi:hypothetical protein
MGTELLNPESKSFTGSLILRGKAGHQEPNRSPKSLSGFWGKLYTFLTSNTID